MPSLARILSAPLRAATAAPAAVRAPRGRRVAPLLPAPIPWRELAPGGLRHDRQPLRPAAPTPRVLELSRADVCEHGSARRDAGTRAAGAGRARGSRRRWCGRPARTRPASDGPAAALAPDGGAAACTGDATRCAQPDRAAGCPRTAQCSRRATATAGRSTRGARNRSRRPPARGPPPIRRAPSCPPRRYVLPRPSGRPTRPRGTCGVLAPTRPHWPVRRAASASRHEQPARPSLRRRRSSPHPFSPAADRAPHGTGAPQPGTRDDRPLAMPSAPQQPPVLPAATPPPPRRSCTCTSPPPPPPERRPAPALRPSPQPAMSAAVAPPQPPPAPPARAAVSIEIGRIEIRTAQPRAAAPAAPPAARHTRTPPCHRSWAAARRRPEVVGGRTLQRPPRCRAGTHRAHPRGGRHRRRAAGGAA